MNVVRAAWKDLTSAPTRYGWLEYWVRNVPGELGFLLRRWLVRTHASHVGDGLHVYEGVRIMGIGRLTVGDRCRIGINNVIQANGEVTLGDDVILGPGVKIWSVNHVFADLERPIWGQGYEHKPVIVGRGTWIGADTFIMPGANIGDHCVISAGSVVAGKDVPPFSILAGNPARAIGSRKERSPVPAASGSPA